MKGREAFLEAARVADRQLWCVIPSRRLPPLTSPAARLRLGVAEQGSMEIRCV